MRFPLEFVGGAAAAFRFLLFTDFPGVPAFPKVCSHWSLGSVSLLVRWLVGIFLKCLKQYVSCPLLSAMCVLGHACSTQAVYKSTLSHHILLCRTSSQPGVGLWYPLRLTWPRAQLCICVPLAQPSKFSCVGAFQNPDAHLILQMCLARILF